MTDSTATAGAHEIDFNADLPDGQLAVGWHVAVQVAVALVAR